MPVRDFNIFSFAKKINRPLILDGALGSVLQQMGADTSTPLWSGNANLMQPELVLRIHREYIDAGADIITTNTFRTNPAAIKNSGIRISPREFVKKSVEIALEAKGTLPVLVAGSNAPAEDCYQVERKLSYKELESNHTKHIELLWDSGCDFILNETQSHIDEIQIVCNFCSKNNIPYIVSLFFNDDLRLLSGEQLYEAIKIILDYNPLAVSFNCVRPDVFEGVRVITNDMNWGVYLNCGSGKYTDDIIQCGIDEHTYSQIIKRMLPMNPSFIGACCGSNPKHIKQIWNLLNGIS